MRLRETREDNRHKSVCQNVMYAFDKDTFFWSGEIENAFTHVVWNSAVTVLALNFRVTFYRCSTPSFGVFIFTACLASYAAS